ncbi:hypothetical protein MSAN_00718200 [Mycena sanguinolenta]|uniref:P-loop containing nucleoside triphosphate hydrolase protein n=1 Tax=Mycena sanguinolenta TaxID=230812 RepID=A0A8H6Z1E6_9AGAR|nr:hypothetical protein MSAN_00718200 [Mycena sanguinolenta]
MTDVIPAGKQVVLILVGLIGSGKSTFAQALQEHFPELVRCNQDDLGDRRAVEHLARLSLRNGSSVCIDRTNFDASDPTGSKLHASFQELQFGFLSSILQKMWVLYVFNHLRLLGLNDDFLADLCLSSSNASVIFIGWAAFHSDKLRLLLGTEHPTIKNPEDALSILDRFSSQYRPPSEEEGYDRILYLQPSEQEVEYSHSSLAAILQRIRDAPAVTPSVALSEGIVGAAVFITSITLVMVALAIIRRRGV